MKLIPATQDDQYRLWQWRNDPAYRRYCDLKLISFEAFHIIDGENNAILIADFDNSKVGFILLSKKDDICEINLCVDRERRGDGLGTSMIGLGSEYAMQNMQAKSLVAYIHPENYKALFAFDKARWRDGGTVDNGKGRECVRMIYP